MDDSEESERYSRRELLRKGLMAGGSMALFGLTLAKVSSANAASNTGKTLASVSITIAPQWPWGAAVNPVMPGYLSPVAGGGGGTSSGSIPPPGGGTGIGAPLLIVPLLVSVDLGHPPMFPPFNVHVVATGDALKANSVQFDVPFTREGGLALGRTQMQSWLGVFPVELDTGSIFLNATLEAIAGAADASTASLKSAVTVQVSDSTYSLSGDFGLVPLATSLTLSDQQTMMNAVGAQSQVFGIGTLFKLVSDATVSAKAKLLAIKNRRSAISIGDMFEMQMLMSHKSQLDELSTSVVSSLNDAISSMARNVKG